MTAGTFSRGRTEPSAPLCGDDERILLGTPTRYPGRERPLPSSVHLADQVQLFGTPNAHPRTHTPRRVHHGRQLANEVAVLPTPTARDWRDTPGQNVPVNGYLGRLVAFLPTPTANSSTGAGTEGRDGGPNLQTAVADLDGQGEP